MAVIGNHAPAFTVASLATTRHSRPFTGPQVLDPLPHREFAPIVLLLTFLLATALPDLRSALLHGLDERLVVGGALLEIGTVGGGVGAKGIGLSHERMRAVI